MTILQMLLIALFYATCVGVSPANSLSQFLGGLFFNPLTIGTVVGIILGDVYTGMLMGGTIALIYLGLVSVGGEGPANPGIAAIMGVSLGMASGLDAEGAVMLAVPFGIMGNVLPTVMRNIHLIMLHAIQDNIKKGNIKKANVWFFSAIPMRVILTTTITFLSLLGGSVLLDSVLNVIPDSVISALSVVGKTLPAVGFAIGMYAVTKKKSDLAFFILAFLAYAYLGVPVIVCTVVSVLYCILKYSSIIGDIDFKGIKDKKEEFKSLLSWQDLAKYEAYRWFFGQNIMNYEDFNGTGKAMCLLPLLKKLYPDNKEKQVERIAAHMQYFNSNVHTETLIFGMVASMEEQKAAGKNVPDEAISAVKAGLMGPLAGVGDPLVQGVLSPLFVTFGISLANNGLVIGGFTPMLLYLAFTIGFAILTFTIGYKGGKNVVANLFTGDLMNHVTDIGAIVALSSFGALAAQTIKFSAVLDMGGVTLQSLFDNILIGILPLSLTLWVYSRIKAGTRTTRMLMIVFAGAFVLGLLGVIG